MNGDKINDIISGSYSGGDYKDESGGRLAEVYVFYGRADGGFDERKLLTICHTHAIVNPADWDNDGDIDLITADRSSRGVYLMVNIGSQKHPKFEKPKPLIPDLPPKEARALLITSAAAVDWDKDGLLDVVAGTEWGSILLFKNEGTKNESKLGAKPHVLAGKNTADMSFEERRAFLNEHQWGSRLALSVCDWDGDGVLDLLAGDKKSETLTEEQVLEGASKEDRVAYQEAKEKMKEYDAEYKKLRESNDVKKMSEEELKNYQEVRSKFLNSYAPYREIIYRKFSSRRSHGYVWVFKGVRN